MATHDYDIANQSGANFRSDLNNCLDAIVSNNSNSSAPSTTFAYMLWVDTANNLLKLRNSANNAWITLPLSVTTSNTVDINGIGLYTLGKYRKSLTDTQKKQYNELFKNYFLKSFSSRLVGYSDAKIAVLSEEIKNEKYTIVFSKLVGTADRPEVKIDWRVYTKDPENPLIRDLIIEGLSLARTQKEEFSSILNSNNGDINALFKTLEEFSQN